MPCSQPRWVPVSAPVFAQEVGKRLARLHATPPQLAVHPAREARPQPTVARLPGGATKRARNQPGTHTASVVARRMHVILRIRVGDGRAAQRLPVGFGG